MSANTGGPSSASHPHRQLRTRVQALLAHWHDRHDLSRPEMVATAGELAAWRRTRGIDSMWPWAPLMLTATLDDFWGHGLELIHLFADAVGLRYHPLGTRANAQTILAACRTQKTDILGMTVLQTTSIGVLADITGNLPPGVAVWVGGRIFDLNGDLARRAGVHQVVPGIPRFLSLLLQWPKIDRT